MESEKNEMELNNVSKRSEENNFVQPQSVVEKLPGKDDFEEKKITKKGKCKTNRIFLLVKW